MLWNFAALAAAGYCLARSIIDLRARRYGWGSAGLLSAAVFLAAPVQTHTVTVDLPVAEL